MENLGERISLLSWLRYANLDQHRSPWMRRIRENVKEEEAERESERDTERDDPVYFPQVEKTFAIERAAHMVFIISRSLI